MSRYGTSFVFRGMIINPDVSMPVGIMRLVSVINRRNAPISMEVSFSNFVDAPLLSSWRREFIGRNDADVDEVHINPDSIGEEIRAADAAETQGTAAIAAPPGGILPDRPGISERPPTATYTPYTYGRWWRQAQADADPPEMEQVMSDPNIVEDDEHEFPPGFFENNPDTRDMEPWIFGDGFWIGCYGGVRSYVPDHYHVSVSIRFGRGKFSFSVRTPKATYTPEVRVRLMKKMRLAGFLYLQRKLRVEFERNKRDFPEVWQQDIIPFAESDTESPMEMEMEAIQEYEERHESLDSGFSVNAWTPPTTTDVRIQQPSSPSRRSSNASSRRRRRLHARRHPCARHGRRYCPQCIQGNPLPS